MADLTAAVRALPAPRCAYVYDAKAQTLGFSFIGKAQGFSTPMPLRTP